MFMHMGEGKSGTVQIGHTWFAIAIAVIIVVGSYLVLTTGHLHTDHENHLDHGGHENHMNHGEHEDHSGH